MIENNTRKKIVSLYRDKILSLVDVAKRVNSSKHFVLAVLREEKIEIRPRHFRTKRLIEQSAKLAKMKKPKSLEARKNFGLAALGRPAWNKGLTKETDERVALNAEGTKKTRKKRIDSGQIGDSWNKGKTKETSERVMTVSRKLKDRYSDKSKHPNWQGGISKDGYDQTLFNSELKESIRERDGHSCQRCGERPDRRKLDVHHINYDKLDCEPSNLISLCSPCNLSVNHERVFWSGFFYGMLIHRNFATIENLKSRNRWPSVN